MGLWSLIILSVVLLVAVCLNVDFTEIHHEHKETSLDNSNTCNALISVTKRPDPLHTPPSTSYKCSFQPDLNQICHIPGHINCSGETREVTWNTLALRDNSTGASPSDTAFPVIGGPAAGDNPISPVFTGLAPGMFTGVHQLGLLPFGSKMPLEKFTRPRLSPKNWSVNIGSIRTMPRDQQESSGKNIKEPAPAKPIADNFHTSWHCTLPQHMLCDGTSQCLTDECQCEDTDVFYCNDNVGCIAHSNVCDGVMDCRDGSDECLCSDVVQCTYKQQNYCVPRRKYCSKTLTWYSECIPETPPDCTDAEVISKDSPNPLVKCLGSISPQSMDIFDLKVAQHHCVTQCDPKWTHFCDFMFDPGSHGFRQVCSNPKGTEILKTVGWDKLCNGVKDCSGGEDEMKCPGFHFCDGGEDEWIEKKLVCDNNQDCPRGDDECQDCVSKTSNVAADKEMIQNKWVGLYMVVTSAMIIILNIFAGIEILGKDPDSGTELVDRLIPLSVCAYDMLMGFCVGFTFVKAIMFSGKYCLHDSDWRASLECKLLGCFYNISSHGSLIMISLMAFTQCYKCVLGRSVRVKAIASITASIFIINTLHGILPILPFSAVQDVFRASMTFSNNPFVKEYNRTELQRMYKKIKGDVDIPDTYTMLKQLNNISSKPGIFDPTEVGYYDYSPLCIQNFYGMKPGLFLYKVAYLTITSALLVLLTASSILLFHSTVSAEDSPNEKNNNNPSIMVSLSMF